MPEELVHRGELSTVADVLERVEQPTDEHSLCYRVSYGLNQIPPQPVDVVNAVVRNPKLGPEKQERCNEINLGSLGSFHFILRFN